MTEFREKNRSAGEERYYPLDEAGYVLPLASRERVQKPFSHLLNPVVACFQEALGDALVGVYLRGSVAEGSALMGVSDLDAFALVSEEKLEKTIRWEELSSAGECKNRLEKKFNFVSRIEMAITGYREADGSLDSRVAAMMTTQSFCLWGRDVLPELPRLRPGPDLIRNLRWVFEVAPALRSYRAGMLGIEKLDSALKTLIRAAFELVMEQEKRFTTDLYSACLSFEKYYPGEARAIWTAREIFLRRGKAPGEWFDTVIGLAEREDLWPAPPIGE